MTGPAIQAFIGLGSNLEQPLQQVKTALAELDRLRHTRLVGQSPLYRSAPLGPGSQPDYVNAVALFETSLPAEELLDALQVVERQHGRVRGARWGPRTLDLDILLYGDEQIGTGRLSIPHPELTLRAFVLVPLYDIAPDLVLPGLGPLAEHVPELADTGLVRLPSGDD